jgi:hypothetical protein
MPARGKASFLGLALVFFMMVSAAAAPLAL